MTDQLRDAMIAVFADQFCTGDVELGEAVDTALAELRAHPAEVIAWLGGTQVGHGFQVDDEEWSIHREPNRYCHMNPPCQPVYTFPKDGKP